MNLVRPIFCPICSARLFIPTTDAIESGARPITYILPDHKPAIGVNLCQGVVVKVTLCAKCFGLAVKEGKNWRRRCRFRKPSPRIPSAIRDCPSASNPTKTSGRPPRRQSIPRNPSPAFF